MIISVSNHADRIRLTAIEIMNGAFGTEGALRFSSGYRWPDTRFFVQKRQHFFHERVGSDAMLFAQDWNSAVLDELVRPSEAHHRRVDHLRVQMLHHCTTKAVMQNVIFNRAHDLYAAREKFQRARVHGLDPARIDERNGNSLLFKFARGFFGDFKHIAQAKNRHVASVLYNFGLANLEKLGFGFDLYTGS